MLNEWDILEMRLFTLLEVITDFLIVSKKYMKPIWDFIHDQEKD